MGPSSPACPDMKVALKNAQTKKVLNKYADFWNFNSRNSSKSLLSSDQGLGFSSGLIFHEIFRIFHEKGSKQQQITRKSKKNKHKTKNLANLKFKKESQTLIHRSGLYLYTMKNFLVHGLIYSPFFVCALCICFNIVNLAPKPSHPSKISHIEVIWIIELHFEVEVKDPSASSQ